MTFGGHGQTTLLPLDQSRMPHELNSRRKPSTRSPNKELTQLYTGRDKGPLNGAHPMPTNQRSQVVAVARTAKILNYMYVKEKENAATHPRHPQRGRSNAGRVSGRTLRNPTESSAHIPTQPVRENRCTNPRLQHNDIMYGWTRARCAYERH